MLQIVFAFFAFYWPQRMRSTLVYLCGEHCRPYNSQLWDNVHEAHSLTISSRAASTCRRSHRSRRRRRHHWQRQHYFTPECFLLEQKLRTHRWWWWCQHLIAHILNIEWWPRSHVQKSEDCVAHRWLWRRCTFYVERKLLKFFHEIVIMRKAPLLISTHSIHVHIMRLRAKCETLLRQQTERDASDK